MGTFIYSLEEMINDGTCERVAAYANKIAPIVAEHFGNGKTGGVWTFLEQISNQNRRQLRVVQYQVGNIGQASGKYYALSFEKAARGSRLAMPNSYVANRNPDLLQYGGAFALGGSRGPWSSFSGWPEKVGVVFGVHCNHRCGVITNKRAMEIFMEHGYEFGQELTGMHRHMIEVCAAT